MVKHNQTISRLLSMNCLSVFGHFVGLALKGLTAEIHIFAKNSIIDVCQVVNTPILCLMTWRVEIAGTIIPDMKFSHDQGYFQEK